MKKKKSSLAVSVAQSQQDSDSDRSSGSEKLEKNDTNLISFIWFQLNETNREQIWNTTIRLNLFQAGGFFNITAIHLQIDTTKLKQSVISHTDF